LAKLYLNGVENDLPPTEAKFLYDNLIYPNELMINICEWVESLYKVEEAMDLGENETAYKFIFNAKTAIEAAKVLSEKYCYGKWEQWYRGDRILSISGSLLKTNEIVSLIQNSNKLNE
jgi:hypothetical protein